MSDVASPRSQLDEAVCQLRRAWRPGLDDRQRVQVDLDLGAALAHRYFAVPAGAATEGSDLDEAIERLDRAHRARPEPDPALGATLGALVLRRSLGARRSPTDISRAVELLDAVVPDDDPTTALNLAWALTLRHRQTDAAGDRDRAILLLDELRGHPNLTALGRKLRHGLLDELYFDRADDEHSTQHYKGRLAQAPDAEDRGYLLVSLLLRHCASSCATRDLAELDTMVAELDELYDSLPADDDLREHIAVASAVAAADRAIRRGLTADLTSTAVTLGRVVRALRAELPTLLIGLTALALTTVAGQARVPEQRERVRLLLGELLVHLGDGRFPEARRDAVHACLTELHPLVPATVGHREFTAARAVLAADHAGRDPHDAAAVDAAMALLTTAAQPIDRRDPLSVVVERATGMLYLARARHSGSAADHLRTIELLVSAAERTRHDDPMHTAGVMMLATAVPGARAHGPVPYERTVALLTPLLNRDLEAPARRLCETALGLLHGMRRPDAP